jgi:DNA replication protein DnaC
MTQKNDLARLDAQLQRLHLHYIRDHYQALATKAAEQQLSPLDYLVQMIEGEAARRENHAIERRIRTHVSPSSRPSMTSSGTGRKRSTGRRSDEAAAYIADALMELALQFEAAHLSQIRRHYQSISPERDDDPGQLDLFDKHPPF